jgi:radical SAM protein with 4Fe4S-binding SPASM domain
MISFQMTKDNSVETVKGNSIKKQTKKIARNDPAPPRKLTLEIIKKCFNRCIYCSAFVSSEDSKNIMVLDKAINVIDQFAGMGGVEVNLSGGEPLLHPELFSIANHAKTIGLKVGLFTCGIFSRKAPTKEEQSAIIAKILEVKFDNIEMALHAPASEMHDSITDRSGSFRRTYEFVKELSSKTGCLEINFVPMQINADELEEVVCLTAKLGIRELNILRFMPQGRGWTNKDWLYLKTIEMARLNKMALQLIKRNALAPRISVGHPGDFTFLFDKERRPKSCDAGVDQCMVMVNGDVIPCPAFRGLPEWIAGNVFPDQLHHIWNYSKPFVTLRDFIPQNLLGKCETCRYLLSCRGRCTAERIRHNADLYQGPDPGCPRA